MILTVVLHLLALETMNTRYPKPNWWRIFTYCSFMPEHHNVGALVFSNHLVFYIPVGANRTAYGGEP